jgi:Protein of unknown function (DUF2794)
LVKSLGQVVLSSLTESLLAVADEVRRRYRLSQGANQGRAPLFLGDEPGFGRSPLILEKSISWQVAGPRGRGGFKKEPAEAGSSTPALCCLHASTNAWSDDFPGGLGGLTKNRKNETRQSDNAYTIPPYRGARWAANGRNCDFYQNFWNIFRAPVPGPIGLLNQRDSAECGNPIGPGPVANSSLENLGRLAANGASRNHVRRWLAGVIIEHTDMSEVESTDDQHGAAGVTAFVDAKATRQASLGPTWFSSASSIANPQVVTFDRHELRDMLNLYGRKVAEGEWRDYAIDFTEQKAVFSIYRRTSEYPLYRIEKNPKLARKQGAYSVIAATGLILKRGHELARVIAVLDTRLKIVGG